MSNHILYGMTAALLAVSYVKDRKKTRVALVKAWKSFENILPEFLGVITLVGVLIAALNPQVISRLLGSQSGWLGVMLAAIVGAITLIPGFVAFPMAAILLQNGVGYTQMGAFISTLMMVGIVGVKGAIPMSKGTIYAISVSPERGQLKKEVSKANLIANHGIENDGHAGDWGRQITCLNWASVQKANIEHHLNAGPGDFAENILIDGLDLSGLTVGSKIRLASDVVLEVTQIGKEDHPSIVSRTFGVSLLPSEGLFCKVIKGGKLKKRDSAEIIRTRDSTAET